MKKSIKAATVAMAASLCAIAGIAWVAQPSQASTASAFENGYVRPYIHDDGKTLTERTVSYLGERGKARKDMCLQVETRTSYQTVDGVKRVEQIEVVVSYEWERIPTSLREDVLNVTWNEMAFCLLANSFQTCDTTILERQPLIGKSTFYEEKFEQKRPKSLDCYGITYEAKLYTKYKGNRRLTVNKLYGSASFVLVPTPYLDSLSDQGVTAYQSAIIAHYYHTRNAFHRANQTSTLCTGHFDHTDTILNSKIHFKDN